MPTTDLVQSPLAESFAGDLQLLANNDLLYFVGSTIDLSDLQASKRAHFGGTQFHQEWLRGDTRKRLNVFQSNMHARASDTTADVRARWYKDAVSLGSGDAGSSYPAAQLLQVRDLLGRRPAPGRYESALLKVPERLGSHAFLWNVIEELKIFPFETSPTAGRHFELALGWNWAQSYLSEYDTWMVGRIPGVGPVDCGVGATDPERVVDLVRYDGIMRMLGLGRAFDALALPDLIRLREEPRLIYLREGLLAELYKILAPGRGGIRALPDAPAIVRLAESIRDGVLSAYDPVQAVIEAACISGETAGISTAEHEMPAASHPDRKYGAGAHVAMPPSVRPAIAVMVALVEELGATLDILKERLGPLEVVEDPGTGWISYEANFKAFRLVFALTGRGQERAAVRAALVLAAYRPVLAVSLGIAGALSDDLLIGDVVVGDQIISYLANAKATPHGEAGFEFQFASDPLRSDELLVDRAVQLPFVLPSGFRGSRERVARTVAADLGNLVGSEGYRIRAGPVACGSVVSAAHGFRKWLKGWKRDLVAIDMETSGIAIATSLSGTKKHVRFLALRGISDLADDSKGQTELITKGGTRLLAMRSSLEVLLLLLESLSPALLT